METEEPQLSRMDDRCLCLHFLFSEHLPVQPSGDVAQGAQKRTLDIHWERTVLESHVLAARGDLALRPSSASPISWT